MQPRSDLHSAGTRGSSANSVDISWHSANTAKTYQALSLFANVKANLHTSPAAPPHGTAATQSHSTRRGSAPPAGRSHTPHAPSRHEQQQQQQPRRDSANTSISTSPTRDAAPSTPLSYTEAEVASMSPMQLRRQLRVAAAATTRLHRRTVQLEKEVEAWKAKWEKEEVAQQRRQGGSDNNTTAATRSTKAAEEHAERLQAQVKKLTAENAAMTRQLQATQRAGEAAQSSPPPHPAPPPPSRGADSTELLLLRDTVTQLQRRLDASEQRVRRATQLQLDALLAYRTSAASQEPPTVAVVNAEVQRLFELMQEQLLSNATQQQVERGRMNELFYQLERQRGLM